jgi:hypothetical protein
MCNQEDKENAGYENVDNANVAASLVMANAISLQRQCVFLKLNIGNKYRLCSELKKCPGMFLYTVFCMERQVDFLILRTRPHTQELSLSANMCDENVKLACVAIIIQADSRSPFIRNFLISPNHINMKIGS